MTVKKLYLASVFTLVFALTLTLFFVSCTNDSQNVEEVAKLEFLDVDVSNLSTLNKEQKIIFEKAKSRIDSSITYNKTKKAYNLKISNGAEIKISERLFDLFKSQMDKSNEMLNEVKNSTDFYLMQDIKAHKIIHIFKNQNVFKKQNYAVARLQTDTPEGNRPPNSTGIALTWWGAEVYISHDDLRNMAYGTAGSAVLANYIPVAGTIVSRALALDTILLKYYYDHAPDGIIIDIYHVGDVYIPWVTYQ